MSEDLICKSKEALRVICRCKRCNQKMMECEYVSGSFVIETKCTRCTRVLVMRGEVFADLVARGMENDQTVVCKF